MCEKRERALNYREIGLGRFFPPIIPNGRFFALAIGGLRIQEILQVTDVGLECGGVSFSWGDICGYAIQGNGKRSFHDVLDLLYVPKGP